MLKGGLITTNRKENQIIWEQRKRRRRSVEYYNNSEYINKREDLKTETLKVLENFFLESTNYNYCINSRISDNDIWCAYPSHALLATYTPWILFEIIFKELNGVVGNINMEVKNKYDTYVLIADHIVDGNMLNILYDTNKLLKECLPFQFVNTITNNPNLDNARNYEEIKAVVESFK